MSVINHVLLEVYCHKEIRDPDVPCPSFCPTQGERANYQCLFNKCPYVDFTSCENTLCYIGGASDEEYGISLAEEDQISLDMWKKISTAKIDEAYDAYGAFRQSPEYLAHVSRMKLLSQMRAYCNTAFGCYVREYEKNQGSLSYVKYLFHAGLRYELEKLVDRIFSDDGEFHDAVSMAILTAACETRTPNHVGTVLVEREAERTKAAFGVISPDCAAADIPYRRVICGEERENVLGQMESRFGYSGSYWHPIVGEAVKVDCLFVMEEVVEDRWDRILPLLSGRIYAFGEINPCLYECNILCEVDGVHASYGGQETAYCDKNFSWIIYFSHEGSVTFGGSLVSAVKEILKDRHELWDKMFW